MVTEVLKIFGSIIGRVYHKREKFDVQEGSHMASRLFPTKYKTGIPMEDLEKIFKTCPSLSLEEMESFKEDIMFMREQKEEFSDVWD